MNLRLKTLLASSLATIVLILGLSIGLSYLILHQITETEKSTLSRRMDEALKSLFDEPGLSDRPPGPEAEPAAPTEAPVQANVALLLDSLGKSHPLGATDARLSNLPAPSPELRDILTGLPKVWGNLPLGSIPPPRPGNQFGIVKTPEGLLLLSERPWPLPSDSDPLRLITGRWVDVEEFSRLGGRFHMDVSLLPLTAPDVPVALRNGSPRVTRLFQELIPDAAHPMPPMPRDMEASRKDVQFLSGFVLLTDVQGKPIGVLQATSPNPFYQRGKEGVRALLVFIWIIGLAFGVTLNLLLDRWVLSRITSMSGQLRTVNGDYNDAAHIRLPGKDELSSLAQDINAMLKRLAEGKLLEEQNREMTAMNAELQRLHQLKDEFLANTSHELRTPLNGMIGIAESMLDGAVGPLSDEQRYNLTLLSRSGKRLTSLVNDILDFSRLRHHELNLDLRPVSLREIAEIVIQLDRSLLGTKPIRIENAIPTGLPLVQADEDRLQQILHNLIGNAIKFTESGTVKISAEQAEALVTVSISDTGIGIPEDKWETIFESFEQVEGSAKRAYGGTGLGLAITRNLLELHGSQIHVTSQLGVGSTFTFTLPVAPQTEAALILAPRFIPVLAPEREEAIPLPDPVRKLASDAATPHILVVDDEPVNLHVVKNFLSLEKYNLTLASDGQEALALLEQGLKPDIILLDVMMPRMTGYEVIQTIRRKVLADRLPIILLSARNQPEDIVMGLEAGANDYLSKPISKEELVARIHTHLQIRQLEEETIRITTAYERQLAQFLEALPIGVAVHNPDHSLFYLNQMAKRLLQDDSARLPFIRALNGEYVSAEQLELQQGDAILPLEVLGTPILDEQGTVIHALSAFQDISERKRAEQTFARLQEATLSRQKMDSELAIAAQIQRSMVPEIRHPEDNAYHGFAMAGLFQPARVVGGDLYDFFPLGEDRLCLVIGDVADKGVPASLLMARTITLIRMLTRPTSSPDDILAAVNRELCVNNAECLFVTLFCGILHRETGRFQYASAGQDPPLLLHRQSVQFLTLETGPPLGLDTQAAFPSYECLLEPDDIVLLYTDGITEAMNPQGDLFSDARLVSCLTELAPMDPAQTIAVLQRSHGQFVGDAPQSDDLTLLAIQYCLSPSAIATDKTGTWERELHSNLAELEAVKREMACFLVEKSLRPEIIEDAQLIAEEVLVNIIEYGDVGTAPIQVQLALTAERLQMTFTDQGSPFDPLTEVASPDLAMDDETRSFGGLGFYLVRELSEHLGYERRDGKNILTVFQPLVKANGLSAVGETHGAINNYGIANSDNLS